MATRDEVLRAIAEFSEHTLDTAGRVVTRSVAVPIDLLTRLFEQESELKPTARHPESKAFGIGQVLPSQLAAGPMARIGPPSPTSSAARASISSLVNR